MSNLRSPPPGMAAISGTFSDYKLIRSRSVLQIVVEVPVERQAEAFAALGYPQPGGDIHVVVARLASFSTGDAAPAVGASRSELGKARYAAAPDMEKAALRAVLLAKDPRFQEWSRCPGETDAAAYIRAACGVRSRSEIATITPAYRALLVLEERFKTDIGLIPEPR